jgi:hypothetical protein
MIVKVSEHMSIDEFQACFGCVLLMTLHVHIFVKWVMDAMKFVDKSRGLCYISALKYGTPFCKVNIVI